MQDTLGAHFATQRYSVLAGRFVVLGRMWPSPKIAVLLPEVMGWGVPDGSRISQTALAISTLNSHDSLDLGHLSISAQSKILNNWLSLRADPQMLGQ